MDWDWMSRFRGSRKAEPADPADETVINGVPYDAQKEIRSSPDDLLAPPTAQNRLRTKSSADRYRQ